MYYLLAPLNSDVDITATNARWNSYYYECDLCHREFITLRTLNEHLNSRAHNSKLYHCPNRNCNKQFESLAALINHLESETCRFIRFEEFQTKARGIIGVIKYIMTLP